MVRYRYDAWGKCTVDFDNTLTKIGDVNPFRYRGYYYDDETDLYYLQSRYYDPKVGRFVNGDESIIITLYNRFIGTDHNLFCYCHNNPIQEIDTCGFWGDLYKGWNAASFISVMIALTVGCFVSAIELAKFAGSSAITGIGTVIAVLCTLGCAWFIVLSIINVLNICLALTYFLKYGRFRAKTYGIFDIGVTLIKKA